MQSNGYRSKNFELFRIFIHQHQKTIVQDMKALLKEGLSWQQIITLNQWLLLLSSQEESFCYVLLDELSRDINAFVIKCHDGAVKPTNLSAEEADWFQNISTYHEKADSSYV